jgi:hypothetical protein
MLESAWWSGHVFYLVTNLSLLCYAEIGHARHCYQASRESVNMIACNDV